MTVPVGSVPEGGMVRVAVPVPVLMPVMVVKGPVKVVGLAEVGLTTMTVPVRSVPDGARVKVVGRVADPSELVIVVKGPVKLKELEGRTTMTVPVPSVPEGGRVKVDGWEPPAPVRVRVV